MAQQNPKKLEVDWKTDTSKHIVPLEEFTALLMPDGIPPIDKPEFWDVHRASQAFFEKDLLLDFGVSGMLRNSDLVMWDRQTQSWWQQFTGSALVGELAGEGLTCLSSMIISLGEFIETYPEGLVLSTNTGHDMQYGTNPYTGYDDLENTQLLLILYTSKTASVLDEKNIAKARKIGSVTVFRPLVHGNHFAFAWFEFHPDSEIYKIDGINY